MVMKEEFTNRKRSIMMPVLMGSATGAGIALLLAPKRGKEIRKDLKRFAADTRDQVADVIDEGRDLYEEVGEVVAGAVKTGKKTYDEGTKGLQKLMHKKERSLMAPILVSGVVGAGIALLLAPKSGKEMRGDIKRIAANTQEKIVSAIDKGKALYTEGRKGIHEAVEAGKKAYFHGKEKFLHAA
jgi:gas vesicle protein